MTARQPTKCSKNIRLAEDRTGGMAGAGEARIAKKGREDISTRALCTFRPSARH